MSEPTPDLCTIDGCGRPRHHRSPLCKRCYSRAARRAAGLKRGETPAEQLGLRVDSSGGPDACWPANGRPTAQGYREMKWQGRTRRVHVAAYELEHGAVPPGHTVGHLCHDRAVEAGTCAGGITCPHRACANPAHLTAQTMTEQSLAGVRAQRTHCPQGHEYSEANTYRPPARPNRRHCRECKAAASRRYQARRR